MSNANEAKNQAENAKSELLTAINAATETRTKLDHARQRQQEIESQLRVANDALHGAEKELKQTSRRYAEGSIEQSEVDQASRACDDFRSRAKQLSALGESFPAIVRELESKYAAATATVNGLRMNYWQRIRDRTRATAPRAVLEYIVEIHAACALAGHNPTMQHMFDTPDASAVAACQRALVADAGIPQ